MCLSIVHGTASRMCMHIIFSMIITDFQCTATAQAMYDLKEQACSTSTSLWTTQQAKQKKKKKKKKQCCAAPQCHHECIVTQAFCSAALRGDSDQELSQHIGTVPCSLLLGQVLSDGDNRRTFRINMRRGKAPACIWREILDRTCTNYYIEYT